MLLAEILRARFGFERFRPHQEDVCRAVVSGHDTLLVMPTGAGKSLCYQLPGLARGGTTLVISPLVALIEDQVQSLASRGFRADRIHSGRTRDDSRQAARGYLTGELEFLFIAPERLAVPGFPEMLARRPPSLIAVDEAHCISQWGHDFRPDYRLVGERLAALRSGPSPVPVIGMTATATPLVQDDIVEQLRLARAERFIHGFRRDNLAVEVVEMNPGARAEAMGALLGEPGRVPAIVYAPTRKKAEELASQLAGAKGSGLRAQSYHAGMTPQSRDSVQTRFLAGEIDVMVATVAFGMGIDKPDVRTVIHAALPASVEGYYQEIGRAGRDGLPSRAILLHSFIDQKTHEFFMEQDYPDIQVLHQIRRELKKSGPVPPDELQARLASIQPELFEKALDKLRAHGAVTMEPYGPVGLGREGWERDYLAQSGHRRKALKRMAEFTEAPGCRMLTLVRHFGDQYDSGAACGICDRCRPGESLSARSERAMTSVERAAAAGILAALAGRDGQAAGRLFEDASRALPGLARGEFERVLRSLALAGWVESREETFENREGETVHYRKIFLTRLGRETQASDLDELKVTDAPAKASRKTAGKTRKPPFRKAEDPAAPNEAPASFGRLREWRKEEARSRGVPAFRILSDRVLMAICEANPASSDQLVEVRGMGPKLVRQYGEEILRRLRV